MAFEGLRQSHPKSLLQGNFVVAAVARRHSLWCGVAIPEDICIVGFDDIMLADIVIPPLTTVRMSRTQLATGCVEAFKAMASSSDAEGLQLWVPLELVVRSSTARPRRKGAKR